jgi:hypothetical protein
MPADVVATAPRPLRMTPDLRSAARAAPGGWLYVADEQFDPADTVPPHGLIGAWRIDDAGAVTSEFRGNPDYQPSPLARGWPAPCDDLDRTAQLAAARHATLDDVVIALLYADLAYALEDGGAPALDDRGHIAVFSSKAARPGDPPEGGLWHCSTGRELAVRNTAGAALVVNPGPWQATIAAVELAARAGGEASGYLLAERIDDFLAGDLDGLALHAAFCGAQVFCQAGERPGFLALGSRDAEDRAVPAFTSLVELARFAGQTAWFSALGQDVLNLLPDGYDIVVDPGTARAVRLRGDATARRDPGTQNGASHDG